MNRNRIGAVLVLAAFGAGIAWGVIEFLGFPWWLVTGMIALLLLGLLVMEPATDDDGETEDLTDFPEGDQ